MISEKAIRFVIGIFVVSLVARYLGVELFGDLSFALAILSVATVLASAGMNRIIPREAVSTIDDVDYGARLLATAFFIRLGLSVSIFGVLATCFFFMYEQASYLILLVLASLLFNPFDAINLYQQGIAKVKAVSIIQLTAYLTGSLSKVWFVAKDADAHWFFAIYLFESAFVAVMYYALLLKQRGRRPLAVEKFSLAAAKKFLSESWTEVLAGFGAIMFMRLDQIMLKHLSGSESVGIYSAAGRIAEAWYFVPSAIIAVTFPKIVQIKSRSNERYHDAILMLTSVMVFISVIAAIFFQLTSGAIVSVVFGEAFAESVPILQMLCFSGVFIFLGSASGSWLVAEKKLIWNLYRNLTGLLVSGALNFLLIPMYGAKGAAFSTLVSILIAFYLFDLVFRELRLMFVIKTKALLSLGLIAIVKNKQFVEFDRV